jgi:hypothetical protein
MYILAISNYTSKLNERNDINPNFGPLFAFVIYIWCLTFILIYMLYKFTNLPTYIKSKCV